MVNAAQNNTSVLIRRISCDLTETCGLCTELTFDVNNGSTVVVESSYVSTQKILTHSECWGRHGIECPCKQWHVDCGRGMLLGVHRGVSVHYQKKHENMTSNYDVIYPMNHP